MNYSQQLVPARSATASAAASAPAIARRGFKNVWAKTFAEVNVETLNRFEDGTTVDPVVLVESGILKNVQDGIRILGNGELT